MKKFIAIALVLAIAPLASAALIWDVADNGNGTFGVDLVASDATTVQSFSIGQLTTPGGAISGSSFAAGFTNSDAGYDLGAYGYANSYGPVTAATDGSFISGTLFSFVYTGAAGDTILLGDLAAFGYSTAAVTNDGSAIAGEIVMPSVPEPMTMALLGLGGLFIRRRRA